jgi:hypothetical protein
MSKKKNHSLRFFIFLHKILFLERFVFKEVLVSTLHSSRNLALESHELNGPFHQNFLVGTYHMLYVCGSIYFKSDM